MYGLYARYANAKQILILNLQRETIFFSQEEFSVVQCNQCGLLYTDPCVSEDDIGFYYFPEYGPYKEAGRSKGLVEKLRLFLRQGPDKHFQEILYLLKTNQARRCIKGKDG